MIHIYDDVIKDPDSYVDEILNIGFSDITDTVSVFRGIQPRITDEAEKFITNIFKNCSVEYNFVRQSPHMQEEPNFIHSDEMMGDLTVLLYLNKIHPEMAGTTIYDNDHNKKATAYMKYNRMVVFDSKELHSRNIKENFGEENDSRLVQIIFLQSNGI
ncbi:MAG TPA: hypothetical protein VMV86_03215 [Methanosarcinales archaeon]|nr:hypothetical protein [Methanosarcinales archaeon]